MKNREIKIIVVELVNEKEINVNAENSVGIFAKKAKVSKVGKIKLGDSADSSVATYVSEGGTVNTDDADIDLGTKNQKRVAYYVNGAGSSLTGTKIGKISGYGVGVFLEGKSGSVATLNASTPELNYTQNGNTGNGLIGLFLKGETNISAYKKGITVGDTVDKKYAIGVYADKQGTSPTPYEFSNNIKTGKNGVGIFADNDSNLKYNGKMEIGNGTEAGTGIFIAKKRTGSNKVTLGDNAEITLKGDKGVGAIVSEGAEIVVDNLGVAQSEKFVADKVLVAFSQDGKDVKVGKPTIEGATVEFEVGVTQKGEKVQVLKFKRKNRYARLKGFRPLQTVLTVKKINA